MNVHAEHREEKNEFNVLGMALNLGWMIAGPLVALALLGRYLDRVYNSSPWFIIAGLLLALTISSVLVYRMVRKVME